MKKIKIIEEGILSPQSMNDVKGGAKSTICITYQCPGTYGTNMCWNLYIVCENTGKATFKSCWDNGAKLTCHEPKAYSIKVPLPIPLPW